jgi:hypothetical protein
MPIPVQVVDLAEPASNDRITGRENPADWGFTHIDELWSRPSAH